MPILSRVIQILSGARLAALVVSSTMATCPVVARFSDSGPLPGNEIWEVTVREFSASEYDRAVEAIIAAFEESSGRHLVPGRKGRVGLKVYSNSGPGISTSLNLVRAVASALERRGFAREQLFIIDLDGPRLRSAGFLPPLSQGGGRFEGIPVIALTDGEHFDPVWFYDNPLPPPNRSLLMDEAPEREVSEDERKSLLAVPLLLDVDFWINLPSYTDHPVLGVNGALVNATLWNASNTMRFFRSPANAPAAVAEMAAIPELKDGWIFTLVSLERFQFIGGPIFNSLYTLQEPRIWLSQNPVILDSLMTERIDEGRRRAGFRPLPPGLRVLSYAEQIGLGTADTSLARWRKVEPAEPGIPRIDQDSP